VRRVSALKGTTFVSHATAEGRVAGVLDVLQPFFPFVFAIGWFGGGIVLYFRFRREQQSYLRRFPPIDRYQTLDMYTPGFGNPPGTSRKIYAAMWQRRDDPELERLRREMWRHYGYVALWIFGFPLLTIDVIALLVVAGLVHPH